MATKGTGKNRLKKPLETTLGKAPTQNAADEPFDLSHVQKPIDTSIFGLRQVLSLFHTATDEVKKCITYECEILYECRICRTIFRSLANFILHKRKYCREKYSGSKNWKTDETCEILKFCENDENNTEAKTVNEKRTKSLSNVVENLVNKQQNVIFTQNILNETSDGSDSDKCEVLVLEKIKGCDNALFQTKKSGLVDTGHLNTDLMKSEVMEIHSILDNDEAILGPDGKVLSSNKKINDYLPRKDLQLMCTICDQRFSTKKTLSCHIKYKHNKNRLVYPCPECKDTLSNTWCVFRHLIKVHRKNPAEIKKLRDVVHSSGIIKDQETSLTKISDKEDERFKKNETESQHNQQWMDDFESANDLQMCGGCGRRFERKAALHAHSQICLKRIALCNSIKENNNKHVIEEEERSAKEKLKSTHIMKGSERRKPLVLRRNCRSNKRERNDYCDNQKKEVCDSKNDGVIVISDGEDNEIEQKQKVVKKEIKEEQDSKKTVEEDRHLVKSESVEDSNKTAEEDLRLLKNEPKDSAVVKKEPKTAELPFEIMKQINSKIAEVIDNIKRKSLSAEEFAEDCDSGSEVAPSKQEPIPSEENEDCVIIDNNEERQKQQKEDQVDCKKVLEVILGQSSRTPKKLKDQNVTDVNSNISTLISCKKQEKEDKEDPLSSSDSDVSSPPFEAFNKLESDDSADSVKSASEEKRMKIMEEQNGEKQPNVSDENNYLSKRPKRSRTSTLHKDFLYDTVQIKTKNTRNNREIGINNNNKKKSRQ